MLATRLTRFSSALPRNTVATARLASTTVQKRAPRAKRAAEAKKETLAKGDSATLIASAAHKSSTVITGSTLGARSASTAPTTPPSNDTKAPGNPEPPAAPSGSFLDVKIPSPEVEAEAPVQIPYYPDFWDSESATVKSESEPPVTETPKMVVVGGADTHPGGGPSHNLLDLSGTAEKDKASTPDKKHEYSDSLLDDIASDLQLPPVKEIKNAFSKLFS